jgi:hypothetical protein
MRLWHCERYDLILYFLSFWWPWLICVVAHLNQNNRLVLSSFSFTPVCHFPSLNSLLNTIQSPFRPQWNCDHGRLFCCGVIKEPIIGCVRIAKWWRNEWRYSCREVEIPNRVPRNHLRLRARAPPQKISSITRVPWDRVITKPCGWTNHLNRNSLISARWELKWLFPILI